MRLRIALGCLLIAAAVGCSRGKSQSSPTPSPATPAAGATPRPIPSPLPTVVAEVNGQPIRGGFLSFIAKERIQSASVPPDQQAAVYRTILDNLIGRELLFQEALARKIQADDKEVRAGYDALRARFPTEQAWTEHLAAQGFTPEAFRVEVRQNMTVRALVGAERAKVGDRPVSDAEARAYYDSHPTEFDVPERLVASHILVAFPPGADAAARERLRAKAQGLLDQVRKGADFGRLARTSSDDPGSAKQDGKLPAFVQGQMVKPFDDAAFALKPGQVSGLVESQFGYHIIKLHKRVAAERAGFEVIRERLRAYLTQQKGEQAVAALVEQLKAKAKIDIRI